jgi:hypothetical protein
MSELRRSPRRGRPPAEDLEGPAQVSVRRHRKSNSSLEVYAVLDSQKSGKSSYWAQVTVVKDEFAADADESIWAQQTLK